MEEPEQRPVPELDEPIRRFAEAGCVPDGAEIADDHGGHGHGHGHDGSVRAFEYRGHEVTIATHYEVTIDGEPFDQPLHVLPNGTVTYHGLPQYVVPSAVDLIRGVIDSSYEAPAEVRAAIRAVQDGP